MRTTRTVTLGLLLTSMIMGRSGWATAGAVALDMSARLNFDAFGEVGERAFSTWYRTHNPADGTVRANTLSTALAIWGDHYLGKTTSTGTMLVSQTVADSYGTGTAIGAPADYRVGDFEIGKGLAPASGYSRYGLASWTDPGIYPIAVSTKVNQTLYLSKTNVVVTLIGSQQARYTSLNVLFSGWRGSATGSYSTKIEALYEGDADYTTVWQDVRTSLPATTSGGTLGTMGAVVDSDGTWEDADGVDAGTFGTDGFQAVHPVVALMMNRCATSASSPAQWVNGSVTRYLWTIDTNIGEAGNQGLSLNPNKTLMAIRIGTTASGTNANRLHVFGICAEPASLAGGTVFLVR